MRSAHPSAPSSLLRPDRRVGLVGPALLPGVEPLHHLHRPVADRLDVGVFGDRAQQQLLAAGVDVTARQGEVVALELEAGFVNADFELIKFALQGTVAMNEALGLGHGIQVLFEYLPDEKVFLAARNLPNVGICDVASMDPVVLIRFEKVLVTLPALKLIEERLS